MKLAAKLIVIFMFGVFAIVALFAWQTITRQQIWAQSQSTAHAIDLVGTIQPALDKAFREGGSIQIQRAVEVTTQHVGGRKLRWVDPDDADNPNSTDVRPVPRTTITSREASTISIVGKDGSRTAYTYVPLNVAGENVGAVEVSESMAQHQAEVRSSLIASLISLLGVACLSGIVIYFGGVRLIGRPLEKLVAQVKEIGDGNLQQPPVVAGNDELGQLAKAISNMSSRLEQQRQTIQADAEARIQAQLQLRHADRLSTVGTLAAGVAHELGTPLNVVAGRAGLISSGKLSADEVAGSAATIKSEAERMTNIIRQLLDFARRTPTQPVAESLMTIVKRTCELMEPLAGKSNALVDIVEANDAIIHADPAQIQQVITNLLTNAIHSMPDGGRIVVSTQDTDKTPPSDVAEAPYGFIRLAVQDQGKGMTTDEVEHAFEPFFTTKDIGQGTGLGLSIAYSIVREHEGWIEVDSQSGLGSTFSVYLPKHRPVDVQAVIE